MQWPDAVLEFVVLVALSFYSLLEAHDRVPRFELLQIWVVHQVVVGSHMLQIRVVDELSKLVHGNFLAKWPLLLLQIQGVASFCL